MLVRSVMQWGNGTVSVRIIDWDDRAAVRDFARVSYGCLRDGGTVITRPVSQEGDCAGDAQILNYVDNLRAIGRELLEML